MGWDIFDQRSRQTLNYLVQGNHHVIEKLIAIGLSIVCQNITTKHNKYVVIQILEHFDDTSFSEGTQ